MKKITALAFIGLISLSVVVTLIEAAFQIEIAQTYLQFNLDDLASDIHSENRNIKASSTFMGARALAGALALFFFAAIGASVKKS